MQSTSDQKITNVPAGEIMNVLETERAIDNRLNEKRADATNKVNQQAEIIERNINAVANPSPLLVAGCIFAILFLAWSLYIVLVKQTMSGEWYDADGNFWYIVHNKFTDAVACTVISEKQFTNMKTVYGGTVRGNLLDIRTEKSDNAASSTQILGLWNKSNTVILISGGWLKRII